VHRAIDSPRRRSSGISCWLLLLLLDSLSPISWSSEVSSTHASRPRHGPRRPVARLGTYIVHALPTHAPPQATEGQSGASGAHSESHAAPQPGCTCAALRPPVACYLSRIPVARSAPWHPPMPLRMRPPTRPPTLPCHPSKLRADCRLGNRLEPHRHGHRPRVRHLVERLRRHVSRPACAGDHRLGRLRTLRRGVGRRAE
jgi:hypothetical protein